MNDCLDSKQTMEELMNFKQMRKSKTLCFNTLVPAIAGAAIAFGIDIPTEVIAGTLAVGNFILRFFTNKSVKDK